MKPEESAKWLPDLFCFLMRGCGLGTTLTVMVGHFSLILNYSQSEF